MTLVRSLAAALVAALVVPAALTAQRTAVTFHVRGGLADYARFLEQRLDGREREITAARGPGFGASLGLRPWENTEVRLSGAWSMGDMEVVDDTGDDPVQDDTSHGDLRVLTVGLEGVRYLGTGLGPFTPYAVIGVAAGFWSIEDADATFVPASVEETRLRFGGVGGAGVRVRLARSLGLSLEATTLRLGNPFDGDEAFRAAAGETFDEPDQASVTQLTLGLSFMAGDRRDRGRERHGPRRRPRR